MLVPLTAQNVLACKPGDLIYFRSSGPLAWVVRRWTKSRFAHVGQVVQGPNGISLLESTLTGVHIIPMRVWKQAWVRPMGIHWTPELQQKAESYHGSAYGWLDDLRVAFSLRPKFRGIQCAELVGYMLDAAGLPAPWIPTPENLFSMYGE